MDMTTLAPLAGLLPAAGFFALWYLTARRLRLSQFHIRQQTDRIKDLRRTLEGLDLELSMKEARIARLSRDLSQSRNRPGAPMARAG
ncbi:hypothetical protein KQ247_01980 [Ruegeria pomeroyi]|uniref:Uncharacterized protein n=2 Tax=Ruegeria pomeroyi TaxID=89184 RepID=Q5LQA0_RUEPO|nr:hypothetical protein [Ruegeria pomeroyi]HCE72231.1 hypothetical protein [Ruegeria sp.]AAV95841.1 hypothetical protein SPO2593 [Ruegeria pomeroyi DSS-3]NVK98293.1 hypothetical protein [Ruegeria pomeroyi]NVL02939.1 hypothetical protein [Ruegeria pomeroyi]QWV09413.1 hypothetical protein KQ247_01980 [Ruegeria pomeroyi]